MDIKIKNRDGVKLLTGGKYCDEDLNILFDKSLLITDVEDAILTGTLTEYTNNRITTLRQNAFSSCGNLVKVYVHNVKTVNNLAFASCPFLETIDISSCETLNGQPFQSCSRLLRVIIRQKNKVCNMLYSGIFATCYRFVGATHTSYNPEGLKDGYIYVDDSMVEQYKVATNWSTYADQIKPISELPQEIKEELGL